MEPTVYQFSVPAEIDNRETHMLVLALKVFENMEKYPVFGSIRAATPEELDRVVRYLFSKYALREKELPSTPEIWGQLHGARSKQGISPEEIREAVAKVWNNFGQCARDNENS